MKYFRKQKAIAKAMELNAKDRAGRSSGWSRVDWTAVHNGKPWKPWEVVSRSSRRKSG